MYHRASLAKPVKPQTNLIFLSILSGRLDLTRFSILCAVAEVYWPQFVCSSACVSFTSLPYIAFSASHISR